jgi:hypothetical protein
VKLHQLFLPIAFAFALAASCKEPERDFTPEDGEGGKTSSGGTGTTSGGTGTGNEGGSGGSDPGSGGSAGEGSGGASAGAGGTGEGGSAGEGGGTTTCRTDARRCRGKIPEICSAEGDWQAMSAGCAFGCVNGVCNECVEGTKLCENGQSKACVEGQWEVTPCDNLCEAGDCVDTCTEGTRQCDGLTKVQVCTDGVFVADEECDGICQDGACTGDCRPDASRCQTGSTTIPEVCSSEGVWEVEETCGPPTPACLDGNCVPCTPDAKRCALVGNRPQICSEFGTWADAAPCMTDMPACVQGECRLCEPMTRRCANGRPQQCNPMGTAWVDGPVCSGATPACVAMTGMCGTCTAGDKQCGSQTTVDTCNANGGWMQSATCSGATPVCHNGACTACLPGQRSCSGNTPRICNANGAWVAQTACSGNTPTCVPATGQCACTENAVDCADSSTPRKCTGGVWVPQAQCRADAPVCVGGSCQCAEGTIECTSSTEARVCYKGAWEAEVCGAEKPICVAGQGCLGCTPGTTRCAPDGSHVLGQCTNDGVWKELQTCVDFCSKGECVNPAATAGMVGCDAPTGSICRETHCCYLEGERATCALSPLTKCPSTKYVPISCDGPADCDARYPACCAAGGSVQCVASWADCSAASGTIVCDPEKPDCPTRTFCRRATPNLFTCQGLIIAL